MTPRALLRLPVRCLLAGVAWLIPPAPVAGQPALHSGPATSAPTILLAAREDALWLAAVSMRDSTLFRRGPAERFDLGRTVNGRLASIAAVSRGVLGFFDDGAIYLFGGDSLSASNQPSLPRNEWPIDVLADGDVTYALVVAEAARLMPASRAGATTRSAAPVPFDPGNAAVCLVKFDGSEWHGVAPCEPIAHSEVSGLLRPRLGRMRDHLLLLWKPTPGAVSLAARRIDGTDRDWVELRDIKIPKMNAFWLPTIAGAPTILAAVPGSDGDELIAFRSTAPAQQPDADWSPDPLRLSSLPAGVGGLRYSAAVGFNQHAAMLSVDRGGVPYLRFARFGDEPSEPTVPVGAVISAPATAARNYNLFHLASFVALLAVFAGLLLFRRESMVKAALPPAGFTLAPAFLRLVSFLIDFTPFSLAASVASGAPWFEGFGALASWSLTPGATEFPDGKLLIWWGLSAAGYSLYALVMEAVTGRTVGKVLLGLSVSTERGERPSLGQLFVRNALRLIELLPQFWACAFLVVLSKNRQRLGDIFARTIVVRRAATHDARARRSPKDADSPD